MRAIPVRRGRSRGAVVVVHGVVVRPAAEVGPGHACRGQVHWMSNGPFTPAQTTTTVMQHKTIKSWRRVEGNGSTGGCGQHYRRG